MGWAGHDEESVQGGGGRTVISANFIEKTKCIRERGE